MTSGEDPATREFYADKWSALANVDKSIGVTPQLEGFLAALPAGGSVLELGCGAGRDSKAIIAAGFELDATDGCPELVPLTSAHIDHPVRLMRFDELDADRLYDGVWASACLLHVFRADLPAILVRIHRALKPGGYFFASYKAGEAEGRDDYGRYFNYPDIHWLRAAYSQAADWAAFDVETGPGLQHGGSEIDWHRVTVIRRGEEA
mgnify:CR=1 FL=1